MTIAQAINQYAEKLKKTSASPQLDVEILLDKILNKTKEYLYAYPEKLLTTSQLINFKKNFNRRLKGEPIAYIVGHKEFYGLDFIVNKNVLSPRPETELLVEETLGFCAKKKFLAVIEIGVGSGAIIISLAKKLNKTQFYATDISASALKTAGQNALKHRVKINFKRGDLLEPIIKLPNSDFIIHNSIIVANLPYVETKGKNLLASPETRSLKYEPQIALYGGIDGLKYFRLFFNQLAKFNLQPTAIFLEIGYNQAKALKNLIKLNLPGYKFQVKKDLCGFDRLIILNK